MQEQPIYLDYNSTTPVDPEVLEAMLPYFTQKFGNASSNTHSYGWIADEAVKHVRKEVADFLNCHEQEIIFTSGATEGINLIIKGIFEAYKSKGNHIVTVKTEHKAVLDVCKSLERKGAELTYLDVDKNGLIDLEALRNSITEKTILVSVMYANNETGVLQPIKEIAEIAHQKNTILFSDTTQAAGKIPVNVQELGIDVAVISGHKMYGPKGVGAVYLRRKNPRVTLLPIIEGGGQERGLRSGTLNVPGIVGLGKACSVSKKADFLELNNLKNWFEAELCKLPGAVLNVSHENRLPNTISIRFSGVKADSLIMKLTGLAFSAGSACTSAVPEPSHVLLAMGALPSEALETVRFSIGRNTTRKDLEGALNQIRMALC
jgi:cysteine desulfurase